MGGGQGMVDGSTGWGKDGGGGGTERGQFTPKMRTLKSMVMRQQGKTKRISKRKAKSKAARKARKVNR